MRRLQIEATRDIGYVAADAFEQADTSIGTALALAGDELTGAETAQCLADEMGLRARFEAQPLGEVRAFGSDIAEMFVWINEHGWPADLAALRERHPGFLRLREWIRTSGWKPPSS